MRNFILISIFFLNSVYAFGQCAGYPCDTVWYDENGRLKDEFVVQDIAFQLGRADLANYEFLYGIIDSAFIINMYLRLDSLANAIVNDGGTFEIQVHCDCRINPSASVRYTFARAKSICTYLIGHGVTSSNLIAKGYEDKVPRILVEGEHQTKLTCDYINFYKEKEKRMYETLHQFNRRVVVKRLL